VAALALTGCSGSDTPAPKASSSTPTKSTPTPDPFQAKGLPAGLLAAVRPIYQGGAVPASSAVKKALAGRKVTKGARVTVVGSLGTWKKTPIAVVTAGKDVTLAVGPKWKVVGGWWPSLGVKASLGGDRRVLLIGTDARPKENPVKARGDSLHIVGVDGKGGGGILGIPRDSYMPLASGGSGKVNAALMLGGPGGQTRTVTRYTGVPVEGYLLTGFQGFISAIHDIGGITVVSPRAFTDSYSRAVIKKGANQLYGRAALAYARSRHAQPNGDFDRSLNQGRVLLAGNAVLRLAGPARLPKLLQKVSPYVLTDLSPEQVLTFTASTFITSPGKVHNRVATGGFGMTSDGQSIVRLGPAARALFADMRDGSLR
jgi:LCP family protein required for cell wall assembly